MRSVWPATDLMLLLTRRTDSLAPVSEAIRAKGVDCLIAAGDVSDDGAVDGIFTKIKETFGRLDVLVNNAGICPIRKMDAVRAENMKRTFDINVVSMFLCTKAAVEIMKNQPEGGKIINAASQSSFRETPVTFEYTTTKWSICGMTKAMVDALREYNITVNVYCPGAALLPVGRQRPVRGRGAQIALEYVHQERRNAAVMVIDGLSVHAAVRNEILHRDVVKPAVLHELLQGAFESLLCVVGHRITCLKKFHTEKISQFSRKRNSEYPENGGTIGSAV